MTSDDFLNALLRRPAPQTWLGRFREGLEAPVWGWQYLRARPGLWRYALWPMLLNILITGVILAALLVLAVWLIGTYYPQIMEGREGAERSLYLAGVVLGGLAALFLCLVAAVVAWKLLTGIFCGYFYGRLAEQVERQLGLPPQEIRPISFRYEALDTVASLGWLVAINGGFLILHLVPVVGGLIASVGGGYYTLLILGLDFLGYPLALRGNRRFVQFGYARRRQPETVGLGAAVFLLQFLPIIGAMLQTTAAVGAVLLYRRLEARLPAERAVTAEAP